MPTPRRCWARWRGIDADGTPHTLVLMQGFIRNQGDGWGWTLDFLSRCSIRPTSSIQKRRRAPSPTRSRAYGNFAAAIGRRLAELHAALAPPTDDPAFAPESATAADAAAWADGVREAARGGAGGTGRGRDMADAAGRRGGGRSLTDRRAAVLDGDRPAGGKPPRAR